MPEKVIKRELKCSTALAVLLLYFTVIWEVVQISYFVLKKAATKG
ncbi:MAG: hypothetical protein ANABAC_3304 [Anaerolineae bacterium]|nr:MAG: hypothetical protein ANABAC_3304 [Anaerolineae bacterium]